MGYSAEQQWEGIGVKRREKGEGADDPSSGNDVGKLSEAGHQDRPNLSARFLFFSSTSSILLVLARVGVVAEVGFEVGPVI